jgi:RNA polymerase sigma factor (sigma-70 family)
VNRRPDFLTAAQWAAVVEALPEAHALAATLARRCSSHTLKELKALVEDSLMRRARHFDPSLGKKLLAFAGKHVRRDLIRAAFTRAHDPMVAAGLSGFDTHEEALEVPDLATRFSETPEEKDARARALGREHIGAACYGYTASRAARSPEEELGEHQEWQRLKRAADGAAKNAGALLKLRYEEDTTLEETAAQLQISVRQVQRIEQRAFTRVCEILAVPDQPAQVTPR